MVPFQAAEVSDQRAAIPVSENSAKKRKWEQPENGLTYRDSPKSLLDIELHLEHPLPLDWQRCLDIQSGKIHFYNTKTHKRTSKDPRDSIEDEDQDMSLDLELNLNCESLDKNNQTKNLFGSKKLDYRPPSLFSGEGNQPEMVAAVCMRCHLLVVLCKSSPECPNCKFMHSPDHTSPTLFKRRCRLYW